MSRPARRCPHCKKEVKASSPEDSPLFPFCSERCKMADLGKWFTEEYRVSRPIEENDELMRIYQRCAPQYEALRANRLALDGDG